jgi:AraC-like DNA-binding protein
MARLMAQEYRESPPPVDLQATVACLWEQQPNTSRKQLIVPDGCIDVIWLAETALVVAGADTGPRTVVLPAHVRSSGIRLRPGAAGAFLGRPAHTLRDCQVGAGVVPGLIVDRLIPQFSVASTQKRLLLLASAVRDRQIQPDPLVVAACARLAYERVAEVAAGLGVSERHLHRRTQAAVGYAPKVLARVLRLHRLTRLVDGQLVDRSLAAGYASQAHMSDEVRRLTGLTARQYLVRFLED